MKILRFSLSAAVLIAASFVANFVRADWVPPAGGHADHIAHRHARGMSWHAGYYHTAWGTPISLVVPPTAHMQTKWAWGVSQGEMVPIYHQYRRTTLGDQTRRAGMPLLPTPYWPSHTDQFGVYYIRGPY